MNIKKRVCIFVKNKNIMEEKRFLIGLLVIGLISIVWNSYSILTNRYVFVNMCCLISNSMCFSAIVQNYKKW